MTDQRTAEQPRTDRAATDRAATDRAATDRATPSLEERLRRVEDQLAIYQLISRYGPAVDSGRVADAVSIWVEDGVYDVPGIGLYIGRAQIAELLEADLHQGLIARGSAHVLSLPAVEIDGDVAVATDYGRVYVPVEGGFGVFRTIATRWEFVRTADGWGCSRRTNELLDGHAEARALLARAR